MTTLPRTANSNVASPLATLLRSFRLGSDPLGLTAGWRAYRAYTRLDAQSDADLAARGLTRADLPRRAFDAGFGNR